MAETIDRTNVEAQERVCEILWELLRDAGVVAPYRTDHSEILGEVRSYDSENTMRGMTLVGGALPKIMDAFGHDYAEIQ